MIFFCENVNNDHTFTLYIKVESFRNIHSCFLHSHYPLFNYLLISLKNWNLGSNGSKNSAISLLIIGIKIVSPFLLDFK